MKDEARNTPCYTRRMPFSSPPDPKAYNDRVYELVRAIPAGRVATYGGVARAAGLPGRARQAGYALRVAGDELDRKSVV